MIPLLLPLSSLLPPSDVELVVVVVVVVVEGGGGRDGWDGRLEEGLEEGVHNPATLASQLLPPPALALPADVVDADAA